MAGWPLLHGNRLTSFWTVGTGTKKKGPNNVNQQQRLIGVRCPKRLRGLLSASAMTLSQRRKWLADIKNHTSTVLWTLGAAASPVTRCGLCTLGTTSHGDLLASHQQATARLAAFSRLSATIDAWMAARGRRRRHGVVQNSGMSMKAVPWTSPTTLQPALRWTESP